MMTRQHRHTVWGGAALDEDVGPTPRDPPHTPTPPDVARTRGSEKAATLSALHLAIESTLRLPWSTVDTWNKLRPISQQAQQLGFSVPSWVPVMHDATTMRLLRFSLDEHASRHVDSTKCDFTHILRKHSPTMPDPLSVGLPPSMRPCVWQAKRTVARVGGAHCGGTKLLHLGTPRTVFRYALRCVAAPSGPQWGHSTGLLGLPL